MEAVMFLMVNTATRREAATGNHGPEVSSGLRTRHQ